MKKSSTNPLYEWLANKYDIRIDDNINIIIQNELKKEAISILKKTSQKKPPFCYKKEDRNNVHLFRKIQSFDYINMKGEGLLIPYGNGFKLYLSNNIKYKKRGRINWAHEIGHTYFYDTTVMPPTKQYNFEDTNYWIEEDLAYIFARELLIPRNNLILRRINKINPTLEKFNELTQVYQITKNSLAKKIIIDEKFWDAYLGYFIKKESNLSTEWVYRGPNIKINPSTKEILNILDHVVSKSFFKKISNTVQSDVVINNTPYSMDVEMNRGIYITILIRTKNVGEVNVTRKLQSFYISNS